MDIKQVMVDTVHTAKFNGVHVHFGTLADKSLDVKIEIEGSIMLPEEMNTLIVGIANLLGLGNSPVSLPSSPQ